MPRAWLCPPRLSVSLRPPQCHPISLPDRFGVIIVVLKEHPVAVVSGHPEHRYPEPEMGSIVRWEVKRRLNAPPCVYPAHLCHGLL